ncbi:glucoamylase [Coprinopsis cinerea okayama7|uniref:Glucoamylase n=1 Tax=Coprinopsis cinerea (strain Okayama-7 / 130 / ATCC MYA-4618 / FGSC 9003) TaxID=240176 RepID=A8NRF9_COPC7|nr:glucoamylase [Coprinopsis cinerea okayama7\|eukprot:XP_001835777.2 glucoamylase [Coprinopsis cinerea okayama7\
MRLYLTTTLGLFSALLGVKAQADPLVDAYLAKQVPISRTGVSANVGPDGARSSGAAAGLVIASPSTEDPDYVYTWTRDSALVFKGITERYIRGEDDSLRGRIDDFVAAQATLQGVTSPSGGPNTGGLGEPKFNIDFTAFTGGWGRPQHDGPALRAIALINYANHLVDTDNSTWATERVWPVIKKDLDYTAKNWNYTGFDLWEEVATSSFFTSAVQLRALKEGVTLADRLQQNSAPYVEQVERVHCFLQSYWNPEQGFITANVGYRTGKDANTILASIHTFDPEAGCDATTFQPCSDKALSNLKVVVDSFRTEYSINHDIPADQGVAVGRYTEDVYFGGQPWYLTTSATAEQLYDALIVWDRQESLEVTPISQAFFSAFDSTIQPGTYAKGSDTYVTLTNAVRRFADGFLATNAKYTPEDGSLSEQYDRDDGRPLSATHLTWSYASLLSASAARSGEMPTRSWGAKALVVPGQCVGNIGPTSLVTFKVYAETTPGENIFIAGNIGALSGWSSDNAAALSPFEYPIWNVTLPIPVDTYFEYKYLRKDGDSVVWEADPARRNNSISPDGESKTINDVWRGL